MPGLHAPAVDHPGAFPEARVGAPCQHRLVDYRDLALRNRTYALFVDLGVAPTVEQTATSMGWTVGEVAEGWRRLHDGHALVVQEGIEAQAERPRAALPMIRMANPFSAVPTVHRVRARGRWWFGNCAWDAFGILAALDVDGRIETSCPDCGDPISIQVAAGLPDDTGLSFHCLIPASNWWDDITFT